MGPWGPWDSGQLLFNHVWELGTWTSKLAPPSLSVCLSVSLFGSGLLLNEQCDPNEKGPVADCGFRLCAVLGPALLGLRRPRAVEESTEKEAFASLGMW